MAIIGLGLLAGIVTTLAGMGGGMVLVLGLALFMDPTVALAASGPALLLGNGHRLWMYFAELNRPIAWPYALGGIPGALIGGLLLGVVPTVWVQVAMLMVALAATAKVLAGWAWRPPAGALVPGGFAVGFTASTAGGGGLIAGPMLLASGLTGRSYVATAAAGAIAVHLGRMVGYGASGVLSTSALQLGVGLAALVMVGNGLGERIRQQLDASAVGRLERGVVLGCLGLATVGLVS
ncbi:MAG: putative membrane protein YfcA [Myxococcota bacterium]|jgi:uncharacterized membrane protein YfcA